MNLEKPLTSATQGNQRIRIGISSCLLGQKVRFDGGHKHDRFLTEMLGFFKKNLDESSRHELLTHIEDYRAGLVVEVGPLRHLPLVVPLTLVGHYVRILDVGYLRDQVYLNPHPKELALRNHV